MYGYGTASPPHGHTNNPFLNANTQTAFASSRFPDISGGSSASIDPTAYTQVLNNNTAGGYQQYQQQPQSPYGYQQQQLQSGYNPYGGSTAPQPFQATSQFGQQLAAATISGSSYGYLNGQPSGLPQQQQQLGPAQQQLTNNPGYVAQFDPYGPLSQWDGSSGQQQQPQQYQLQQQQYQQQPQQQQQYGSQIMTPSASSSGVSPTGEQHPREYLRTHKSEIEAWNGQGWKQFFTTFDALSASWNARKTACTTQIQQLQAQLPFAGYYQQQVQGEIARIQQAQKEADDKYGSVVASKFQLQEVFGGYKQSTDPASKRRVREATNAAMQSLPDWPPANI